MKSTDHCEKEIKKQEMSNLEKLKIKAGRKGLTEKQYLDLLFSIEKSFDSHYAGWSGFAKGLLNELQHERKMRLQAESKAQNLQYELNNIYLNEVGHGE